MRARAGSACGRTRLSSRRSAGVPVWRTHTSSSFVYASFFPVSLASAVSIAMETELARLWNSALQEEPVVLERCGGLHLTVAQKLVILCGILKFDSLDEIHRFIDVDGGFMAECIETVTEGQPNYSGPDRGYTRALSGLKSTWVACGKDASVLILTGSAQMPFRVSKRFATTCGGFIGKHIVSGLVKNSMRTMEPGNPWATALQADKFGIYARLNACAASESSLARGRDVHLSCSSAGSSAVDLAPYFTKHDRQTLMTRTMSDISSRVEA